MWLDWSSYIDTGMMLESKLWTLNSYSEAPLCLVARSENNVVAVPVFEDLQQNGIEALQPASLQADLTLLPASEYMYAIDMQG